MKVYNVGIIGAGKIGALLDTPNDDKILTHSKAIKKNNNFNLIAIYDIDINRAIEAGRLWGINYYNDLEKFLEEDIEIIVIASATSTHYEYMNKLVSLDLKGIVLEKPIGKDLTESKKILERYLNLETIVAVNYSRRYSKDLQDIAIRIRKKEFGDLIKGIAYYGKGIFNNGSHMIDLLNMFFDKVEINSVVKKEKEEKINENNISAVLTIDGYNEIELKYINSKFYHVFECDFFFENGRVKILELGHKIEIYKKKNINDMEDYLLIYEMGKITDHKYALINLYENFYNALSNGEEIKCSLKNGYKAMEICSQLDGED